MKKLSVLIIVLTMSAAFASAQNADNKWALGLGGGLYWDINHETDNQKNLFIGETYLSRYLSPSFDIMPKYYFSTEEVNGENGFNFHSLILNFRYKFYNGKIFNENSAVQPYIYAGPGIYNDEAGAEIAFNAGLGVKFPVSKSVAIYIDGAYIGGADNNTPKHAKSTVGLEFMFGKAKDTDGDGVPDKKDKCPDTPPGVAVDVNGCPLDRDGDGVPDYKDDCPDQAGDPKFNGCPDTDGDGIPDKDDDCPAVAGLAKFKGCPDTDEDGVPDNKDKCPGTPKGCPVDANGCPLDSDGDGVIDCEDKCPKEAGSKENNGCPDWQNIQISTLHFDLDKADLKPEGMAELDKLVQTLSASKEYNIVVGGHACDLGTNKHNMELSENRAQAVVKYLLSKGVNNAYVGSKNYGEDKPAVPNTNEDNRKKNRRVEWEVAKVRK